MEVEKKLRKRVEKWLKDTSEWLDISNLELKVWPNVLKGKEDLIVKLDCQINELTSLPLCLLNLTLLRCSHNQLTSLPLRLHKLTKLECSYNQLTSLCVTSLPLSLPNLTELECSNNQLTSLPLLPNLTYLVCRSNQLTCLPFLPNLIKLHCSHNKLTSLPRLPKLTELWCTYNQLTSLPLHLPNLVELMCQYNKLTSLPPNLPNLTALACENNQLTFLPFLPKLAHIVWCETQFFSTKITEWKKVWRLKALRSNEIRSIGLKKVIKVLKNRLYLPRLNQLEQELIYSPNHPGKFYKNLRIGNWSSETQTKETNQTKKP